jgi:hypothetical protein
MDTLWEKYCGFATQSLDMAQDSSSLKDITTLLDIAQFWVQLTEGAVREMTPKRAASCDSIKKPGSLAMFTTMRRASSRIIKCAPDRRPGSS